MEMEMKTKTKRNKNGKVSKRKMRMRANPIECELRNWDWSLGTEGWVRNQIKGFSLNVCCGTSNLGDVRVDIDPKVYPDVIADMHHLPFRKMSFDTVICDPPFKEYFNVGWVMDLKDLARQRVILSTPQVNIKFPKGWSRRIVAMDDGLFYLRLFQIYDRIKQGEDLTTFLGLKEDADKSHDHRSGRTSNPSNP